MNRILFVIAVFSATILPLVAYLYMGFHRRSHTSDAEDFFVYKRTLDYKDFANTSVGYALQMAAIFLFADWGYRYGFGGFWVPVFWLLGYLLLYLLIPKLGPFISKTWTLHGFLRNRFGSPMLQVVAALATILGLWGTMMVEVDYCTSVYQSFLGTDWQQGGTFVLGLFFLAFGVSYVVYGGYKATVNNERLQVPIAYTFFLIVILVLLTMVRNAGYEKEFGIIWYILLFLFLLMIFAKMNLIGRSKASREPYFADKQIIIPVFGILFLLLLRLITTQAESVSFAQMPGLYENISAQAKAQGIVALVSLFVANFFWMPVDISTWQRISSIHVDPSLPESRRFTPIKKGVFRVMLESPISWGFGVVFGMTLKYSGLFAVQDDAASGISKFTEALTNFQIQGMGIGNNVSFLFPIFIVAMIAIMLSTIDELLSAITFTAFDDVIERREGSIENGALGRRALNKARLTTLGICVVGAFVYYGFRYIYKVEIATVLYTFYSSQLALFPSVFGSLYGKKRMGVAAIWSIILGIVAAFVTSFIGATKSIDLSLVSPLSCLFVATITYWLISAVTNNRKE